MRFMPKQLVFQDLLKAIHHNVAEIVSLFESFSREFTNFEEYSRKAEVIEHLGDTKTHEIINKINKTFITPFDREDIYVLAHELDDIVDLIESVIHNVYIYEITGNIHGVEKFTPLISEASVCLERLIDHLYEQKYTPELHIVIKKIHEIEDAGDAVFDEAVRKLFKEERDPIRVIKCKDILEGLEDVLDKYKKVSDIIEGIIVKSS
jgi:uncharacterized protein